ADAVERAPQLLRRADRVPARGGDAEPLEQALLGHAVLAGGERGERRADAAAPAARDRRQPRHRHVLPVEGHDLAAGQQPCQQTPVGEGAVQLRRHLPGGCLARGIQAQEIQPQRIARQCEHAAELAGAHDADGHERVGARGSGLPSTPAVWRSRNDSSAALIAGCLLPRMAAAHNAALLAPAAPMAKVATGTPAGICTMDRSESMPPRLLDGTGTPSTGTVVLAAAMPGRWAAPPAPAISTSRPRSRALPAYSNSRSGVRCADTTRTS